MRRRTTEFTAFIIRSHFNCAPWFVCSQPYILAVKSRTQGNPYARKSRTYRGVMPPAVLAPPWLHGAKSAPHPAIKTTAERVVLLKKTASFTTPPLSESTRYLRRTLRGRGKFKKKITVRERYAPVTLRGHSLPAVVLYGLHPISATHEDVRGGCPQSPMCSSCRTCH